MELSYEMLSEPKVLIPSIALMSGLVSASFFLADRSEPQESSRVASLCRPEIDLETRDSDFWRKQYPHLPLHQFVKTLGIGMKTLDPWLDHTEKADFIFAAVDASDGAIHLAVNGVVLNNPDFENSVGLVTWDEPQLLERRAIRMSYPYYPEERIAEVSYAHVPSLCD